MACQGGFSASPVRLSFHEKISRGRSIFCCPFAQSAPRWFRNRKIRISKTLTARERLFSSWCPGGINISQPKLFSCWGSITALSQKTKNALPGHTPPEGRLNARCVLRLCRRWAGGAMPTPVPSVNLLRRAKASPNPRVVSLISFAAPLPADSHRRCI